MKRTHMPKELRILAVFCVCASPGCATYDMSGKLQSAPQQLFDRAMRASDNENYGAAAGLFREVEEYGRYSELAQDALLQIIYADFRARNWEAAIRAADEFERLYPEHPNVDYCVYMTALVYWDQAKLVKTDEARDVLEVFALKSLQALVRRFPNSDYSADARRRIEYLGYRRNVPPRIIDPPRTLEPDLFATAYGPPSGAFQSAS